MPRNKLGKIFVKYSEPIDIKDYLAKNVNMKFDGVAYKLTKELTLFQKES